MNLTDLNWMTTNIADKTFMHVKKTMLLSCRRLYEIDSFDKILLGNGFENFLTRPLNARNLAMTLCRI